MSFNSPTDDQLRALGHEPDCTWWSTLRAPGGRMCSCGSLKRFAEVNGVPIGTRSPESMDEEFAVCFGTIVGQRVFSVIRIEKPELGDYILERIKRANEKVLKKMGVDFDKFKDDGR